MDAVNYVMEVSDGTGAPQMSGLGPASCAARAGGYRLLPNNRKRRSNSALRISYILLLYSEYGVIKLGSLFYVHKL